MIDNQVIMLSLQDCLDWLGSQIVHLLKLIAVQNVILQLVISLVFTSIDVYALLTYLTVFVMLRV